ncbi:hypothetical protein UFOVP410_113 [uncultured Caudovirales phage]|uniref:Uncharacterized protein n=1 Tax=uncultured Caudovirales phage TaxID=2100421 RepID=A0A6J5M3D6_9CAUD|nr:hypothetical protein UFOVP410_113 [uncultured Caudovirales phage]
MSHNLDKNKDVADSTEDQQKNKIKKKEKKLQEEQSVFDEMLEEIQDDELYHLMKKLK